MYATQAGSLGYVTPLPDESMLPLLQKLQQQMALTKPQAAGLNPAAFRYVPNKQHHGADTSPAAHACALTSLLCGVWLANKERSLELLSGAASGAFGKLALL